MSNIDAGLVQMLHDIVFTRLYVTSDDGIVLKLKLNHMVHGKKGTIYRPSDRMESFLYGFRAYLCDNNLREADFIKQNPHLYYLPSFNDDMIDYLWHDIKATRFGKAGRESYARLLSKIFSDSALMDGRVGLSVEEIELVREYGGYWSGCVEIDGSDEVVR